jgi:hypothetical protein
MGLILGMIDPAFGTNVTQLSWDSYGTGNLGNFDLDLQVNNGLTGIFAPWNATYGTHSAVNVDGSGFIDVNSHLGFVLPSNSPEFVRDQNAGGGALNAASVLSSGTSGSPFSQEGRWVHETSTLAFDPATSSRKWMAFWDTLVKSHPFSGPSDPYYIAPTNACTDFATSQPLGKNFGNYGWIGMRTWSNSSASQPDPDLSTLSAKETRLFVGTGYNNAIESTTNSWATGTPFDPVPSDTKYLVYSEPGAFRDPSSGVLYVAMTGNWCSGSEAYGDIILVKSSNDGATWQYVGVVLTAAQATAIDSTWAYFTASSIHQDPSDGSIRLIVTGMQFYASGGDYQGIVELSFQIFLPAPSRITWATPLLSLMSQSRPESSAEREHLTFRPGSTSKASSASVRALCSMNGS